jgi:hypothetical protein
MDKNVSECGRKRGFSSAFLQFEAHFERFPVKIGSGTPDAMSQL